MYFCVWEAEFGHSRPLTASDSLSQPIKWLETGSESAWEAVRGRERPNSASHRFGLTEFVMWSVWANQKRAQIWESDRPLTHTGRCNAFSREISQASPRIVLPRPVEVRLARCAWEADRPPTRPLTSDSQTDLWGWSVRPWEASDSQTDHMTLWWARPLTHTASHAHGLTDLRVRSASHAHRAMQCV